MTEIFSEELWNLSVPRWYWRISLIILLMLLNILSVFICYQNDCTECTFQVCFDTWLLRKMKQQEKETLTISTAKVIIGRSFSLWKYWHSFSSFRNIGRTKEKDSKKLLDVEKTQRKSGLTKKRRKQWGEENGRNMVWKGRQMNRKWINEQEINI